MKRKNSIQKKIETRHPELNNVVVRRELPNRLILQVREREPVAQIEFDNQYLVIDQNGVILSELKALSQKDLPLIKGCRVRPQRIEIGKRCYSRGLEKALSFLKALSSSGLPDLKIVQIKIKSYGGLSALAEEGFEIWVGRADFEKSLARLVNILPELEADKSNIRYIDLRFRDVIVRNK